MRAAGHGILVDCKLGCKDPRDAVIILASCRHSHKKPVQLLHASLVGMKVADVFLRGKHEHKITVEIGLLGPHANRCLHSISDRNGRARVGREVHHVEVALPLDGAPAHLRVEGNGCGIRAIEAEEHECGAEGRMPAEVDLTARREPAQMPPLLLSHDECRLREPVLLRDVLHQPVGRPFVDDADGSLVPAKELVGKGIDNVLLHGSLLFLPLSIARPFSHSPGSLPGTPAKADRLLTARHYPEAKSCCQGRL